MRNTQNRVVMTMIGLALILLSACDTTKPDNGLANVTINITTSMDIPIMEIIVFRIQGVGTGKIDWVTWEPPLNKVIIKNVEYGSYYLSLVPPEYPAMTPYHFFAEKIDIDKKNTTIDIYIDFEQIDHKIITIQNNTGHSMISLARRAYNGSLWHTHNLPNLLYDGDSINFVSFHYSVQNLRNIRLVDTNFERYTKYGVCFVQNDTVTFTIDDLDDDVIKDPTELYDTDKFDIGIIANTSDEMNVVLYHHIDYSSISLKIDGEVIELFPSSLAQRGRYEFEAGQSYHFEIQTTNPDMTESAYLTMPLQMIFDYPATIDDGQINFEWMYVPDDNQSPSYLGFSIASEIQHSGLFYMAWRYSLFLPNHSRNIEIPNGFVPTPNVGWRSFSFEPRTYTSSGRVAISSPYTLYGIGYRDGVFQDIITYTY